MKKYLINKSLTAAEAAALFWYVFEGEKDWKRIYMAAADWSEEDVQNDPTHFGQYVSKWKATAKVKNELQRLKLVKENYIKEIQKQAYEEGRRSAFVEATSASDEEIKMKVKGQVDYTNPDAQKEKLNEIINRAKDSGEALDALKVIIQGQRNDQDAARNNKIQRFYTPLQCRDCPLYNKAKEKIKK